MPGPLNFDFATTPRLRVQRGGARFLGEQLAGLGVQRTLLVTDPGLRGLVDPLLDGLGLPFALFDGVQADPPVAVIEAALAAARTHGADGVLSIGGGSSLDVAKLVALLARSGEALASVYGVNKARGARLPLILVPTTAGTGSEVGRAAVVTNEKTHTKKIIFHPGMLPKVTVCDPELTVGMPPAITAGTGMDALAHCLEAYCAPSYHPIAEGIAVEGMRLVFANLPKAVANGKDLEARAHMMSAAAMGAAAFQKGLGAIHALSHPVGALYHTHHGMTNGVFMPYVLVFNRKAIEPKIERLAGFLEVDGGFDGFLKAVLELRKEIGVPHDLGGLRVDGGKAELISEMAVVDPTAGGNPIPVTKEGARKLFDAALKGDVAAAA